ncbi:MAG: tRNA epoxyqueuosine(34) reductase QueG [Acidobacteria bacterium]|nr:tRNA epoxyqueuosine(34) reductase QueG [Acidobacteriota bacterium]
MNAARVKQAALSAGFDLAGVAAALPIADGEAYLDWAHRGWGGRMSYLTDHRADVRMDPRRLLPSARSILCVGLVYNGPQPYSVTRREAELGWISRYAWGEDYHVILKQKLEDVASILKQEESFEYRVCVDTAPLLERSYARLAGLGWIGRNTCLIHQRLGSWLFLGEMLLSLDLAPDTPPPDRCGTCRRCIDACPTQALVQQEGRWELDARLCISYFTIELKGAIPEEHRPGIGRHVFGCDICQDVCPWNRRAASTHDPGFLPLHEAPPLERLAAITPTEFRDMFRHSPVSRTRYAGFLRNVAVAMGNSGLPRFREPLSRLAASDDAVVAEHARWALGQLQSK